MWPIEWHQYQWPWVILKVTSAVWNLGKYSTYYHDMFAHESESVRDRQFQLSYRNWMTSQGHRQSLTYTVKVVVSRKRCKTETLLLQTTKAPLTRYNLLSNRLPNRFDNRLYRVYKHSTGCQTRLTTDLTNRSDNLLNEQCCSFNAVVKRVVGLTTGWMFVYTIQPAVKPVVQPVWQPVVSCKRGLIEIDVWPIKSRHCQWPSRSSPITSLSSAIFRTVV